MKIIDAYALASTKRKTRRTRTAIITVISSLLFAVLFFAALLLAGLQQGAEAYKNVGLNDRFIAKATPLTQGSLFETSSQQASNEAKADLAKRGIKLPADIEENPEFMNEVNDRMSRLIDQESLKQLVDYEATINTFSPQATYHLSAVPRLSADDMGRYQNDKDSYLEKAQKSVDDPENAPPGEATSQWTYTEENITYGSVESGLLSAFKQPSQSFDWRAGDPYPVLVSYQYLRQRLGNTSVQGLSAAEVSARYADLIKQHTGDTLSFCYRDKTAQQELDGVLRYNKKVNEDKDTATVPIAVENCKSFDQAVLKKHGLVEGVDPNAPKPLFPKTTVKTAEVRIVTFKIVGFLPAVEASGSFDILSSLTFMVNDWQMNNPFLIPAEVVKQDEWLQQQSSAGGMFSMNWVQPTLFVEFNDRAQQKTYIDSGCQGMECVGNSSKPIISSFGSVKVALEEVITFVLKGLIIAVLVVGIIASVMFMTTISKIIADSVREIAVFRAIGASRWDIAQIYVLYGLMIAVSSLLAALCFAALATYAVSSNYSEQVSQTFVSVLGAYDQPRTISLLGVEPLWLAVVAGALFFAALLGIIVAVVANMHRNIVKYMREE